MPSPQAGGRDRLPAPSTLTHRPAVEWWGWEDGRMGGWAGLQCPTRALLHFHYDRRLRGGSDFAKKGRRGPGGKMVGGGGCGAQLCPTAPPPLLEVGEGSRNPRMYVSPSRSLHLLPPLTRPFLARVLYNGRLLRSLLASPLRLSSSPPQGLHTMRVEMRWGIGSRRI